MSDFAYNVQRHGLGAKHFTRNLWRDRKLNSQKISNGLNTGINKAGVVLSSGAQGAASGLAYGARGAASGLAYGALGAASGVAYGARGAASGAAYGARETMNAAINFPGKQKKRWKSLKKHVYGRSESKQSLALKGRSKKLDIMSQHVRKLGKVVQQMKYDVKFYNKALERGDSELMVKKYRRRIHANKLEFKRLINHLDTDESNKVMQILDTVGSENAGSISEFTRNDDLYTGTGPRRSIYSPTPSPSAPPLPEDPYSFQVKNGKELVNVKLASPDESKNIHTSTPLAQYVSPKRMAEADGTPLAY